MTTLTVPQIHNDLQAFLRKSPHKLLIGGQWAPAVSGKTFETYDPATGDAIAQVAEGGAEDIDRAVKAARAALEGPWGKLSPAEREKLLHKAADLIEKH